jgi:cation transport ATPase
MTGTFAARQSALKTENIIAALSILGISGYLVLKYALDTGHEVFTLSVNAALTSAMASLYEGQFGFCIVLVQLPLLAVLTLGGIPLVYQLTIKLLRGDFGADLLAGLSIVTAVVLDEYLAGSLVVLMLSGGTALEHYAVRKASSVLQALAKRMPAVAHRKSENKLADITTE